MEKQGSNPLRNAAILTSLPFAAAAAGGYGGSILGTGVGGLTSTDEREGMGRGYYRGGLLGAGLASGAVTGGMLGTALGTQEFSHNVGSDDKILRVMLNAGVGSGLGALAGGAGAYALGRHLFGAPRNTSTSSSAVRRATSSALGAVGAATGGLFGLPVIPPTLAQALNDEAEKYKTPTRITTADNAGYMLPTLGGGAVGAAAGGITGAALSRGSELASLLGALAGGGLGAYVGHTIVGGTHPDAAQMDKELAQARAAAKAKT